MEGFTLLSEPLSSSSLSVFFFFVFCCIADVVKGLHLDSNTHTSWAASREGGKVLKKKKKPRYEHTLGFRISTEVFSPRPDNVAAPC